MTRKEAAAALEQAARQRLAEDAKNEFLTKKQKLTWPAWLEETGPDSDG